MPAEGYTSDPAAVDSVNGQTGAVVLDAGDVGALGRVDTVAPDDTVVLDRVGAVDNGSANMSENRLNGVLGTYVNERACLRARAGDPDQYAFRAQCHSSKNGTNQPIGSFADSNNVDQLMTRANGDTELARDLLAGRHVTATSTVTGASVVATSTLSVNGQSLVYDSGYTPATLATGMETVAGFSAPGSIREGRRVFLRGRMGWTSQTFAGGAVLMTVTAAHRPLTTKTFSVRTGSNSNVATVFTLNANGELQTTASLGAATTAYLGVDGLNYDLEEL